MLRKTAITLSVVFMLSVPTFAAQMDAEQQKKVDAVFDATDADKNDSLSQAEWDLAMKATFQIIDLDSNGKVSRDEYRKSPETLRAKFQEAGKSDK